MKIKSKNFNIWIISSILIIISILVIYNVMHINYISIDAKVVNNENIYNYENRSYEDSILVKYEYNNTEYTESILVLTKHKVGSNIKIKIDPNNPLNIFNPIINYILIPFLCVLVFIYIHYTKNKK